MSTLPHDFFGGQSENRQKVGGRRIGGVIPLKTRLGGRSQHTFAPVGFSVLLVRLFDGFC